MSQSANPYQKNGPMQLLGLTEPDRSAAFALQLDDTTSTRIGSSHFTMRRSSKLRLPQLFESSIPLHHKSAKKYRRGRLLNSTPRAARGNNDDQARGDNRVDWENEPQDQTNAGGISVDQDLADTLEAFSKVRYLSLRLAPQAQTVDWIIYRSFWLELKREPLKQITTSQPVRIISLIK